MTQWLLEHHANPNSQCGPDGVTPLMIAAKFSFPECIILLLRYEAEINKQNVSAIIPPPPSFPSLPPSFLVALLFITPHSLDNPKFPNFY
jgi:ankyrin repeat protein